MTLIDDLKYVLNNESEDELIEWFCKIKAVKLLIEDESPLFADVGSTPNYLEGIVVFDKSFLIFEEYGLPYKILTPLGSWRISRGGVTEGITTEMLLNKLGIKYERLLNNTIQITEDHKGNLYPNNKLIENYGMQYIKSLNEGHIPSDTRINYNLSKTTFDKVREKVRANKLKGTVSEFKTTCIVSRYGTICPSFNIDGNPNSHFTSGELKYFQMFAGKEVEVIIKIKN